MAKIFGTEAMQDLICHDSLIIPFSDSFTPAPTESAHAIYLFPSLNHFRLQCLSHNVPIMFQNISFLCEGVTMLSLKSLTTRRTI